MVLPNTLDELLTTIEKLRALGIINGTQVKPEPKPVYVPTTPLTTPIAFDWKKYAPWVGVAGVSIIIAILLIKQK